MAGVISVGGRQREMYMAQFNRMASGRDEDPLTKELDRQAAEDAKAQAEKRLEDVAGATIAAGRARTEQGAQRTGAYVEAQGAAVRARKAAELKAYNDILEGRLESARKDRELQEKLPVWRAQTGEAGAHATLFGAQTEEAKAKTRGEQDKNAREVAEGLVNDSERIANHYIGLASGGQPIDKYGTDEFVKAMQHLGNNKFYDVPRNPDGGWKYDPKQVAQQFPMTDDKGIPTFRTAKDLRTVNMPVSDFGRKLQDVRAILDDPNQTEDMKRAATNELVSISSPTMPKIQGAMVQKLVDLGAYPQAINLMKDFQNKDGSVKGKLPGAAAQTDMANRISVIGTQNELMDRWKQLNAQGLIPVGTWRKPVLDLLKDIGANNPDVQTFRDLLNLQVSQYMNLMHGRRYMEKEMEFIMNSMPSQYDSPATFEKILGNMRAHMIQDVRERAGSLADWGFQVPKGIEPIPVIQTLNGGRKPAGLEFDDGGTITPEMIRDQAIGLDLLRKQNQRSGQDIGGKGAFRSSQLGMTADPTAGAPTAPVVDDEKAIRDEIANMTPEQIKKELGKVPNLDVSPEDMAKDLADARKETLEQAQTP